MLWWSFCVNSEKLLTVDSRKQEPPWLKPGTTKAHPRRSPNTRQYKIELRYNQAQTRAAALRKELGDFLFELGLLERAALDFVKADGVHEKLGAQKPEQLAHVELGDEDFLVALENVAEVARKRVQMAQMDVADAMAEFALRFYGGGDGTVRGAPGDDEQVAIGIALGDDVGNVLSDGLDFRGADANHLFVIERFVVDVAGDVLFFQAADAVFEARRAGDGPGAREGFRIAAIGLEVHRVGGERHLEVGNRIKVRDFPGFSAVGEVAVGKNDDRYHVFDGDAGGFQSGPEAVAGSGGGDDGNGSFGVAAEESLQQVGLFGFGWQAGGWAAALDVANDQRDFHGNGQAHGLGFESHTGTGSGGDG